MPTWINITHPGFSGRQEMPDDGDEWISWEDMARIVRKHNEQEARREQIPKWAMTPEEWANKPIDPGEAARLWKKNAMQGPGPMPTVSPSPAPPPKKLGVLEIRAGAEGGRNAG